MPSSDRWDALPSVTRLRSRPVVSFVAGGGVWQIGWNGSWVKAWSGLAPRGADGGPGVLSRSPPG